MVLLEWFEDVLRESGLMPLWAASGWPWTSGS